VEPGIVEATKDKPAGVTLKWTMSPPGAKAELLQSVVNGKSTSLDKNTNPQKQKVSQTTEYVLEVKGPPPENRKATCSACVQNRSERAGRVLNIPPVYQQNKMWCWLTVGQMIFTYYGAPDYNPWKPIKMPPPPNLVPDKLYQWGILSIVHPGCWQDPDKCWALGGGSWANVARMLEEYPAKAAKQKPIASTAKRGCLTADQIKKEIDEGRPVLVGITPGIQPPPAGDPPPSAPVPQHVVLIVGYQQVDGDIELIVNDPWPYAPNANPYTTANAGGTRNCEANYTIRRDKFCQNLGWQGSFVNVSPQ
jgi:hypothetical protein